jgi:hypothetical protein
MIAARTSETLVDFYQTTWHYIPEDSHLRTHRRENLKSYLVCIWFYLVLNVQTKVLHICLKGYIKTGRLPKTAASNNSQTLDLYRTTQQWNWRQITGHH